MERDNQHVRQIGNLSTRRQRRPRRHFQPIPPIPPQPVLNENPEWRNIGVFINTLDFSNYEVCRQGLVRNIKSPVIMKTQLISDMGYRMVRLRDSTRVQRRIPVHNLVAYTFHRDTYHPDTPAVAHINKDKLDNRAENLRWVTSIINVAAATGARVRRKDLISCEIVDYPSILACVRENPGDPGLRLHLSKRMDSRLYRDFEFQRIDPPRQRPRRRPH